MIKDESLFIDIDKEYSGTITNALETSERCNLANEDPLSLWHKRLGHNNIEDNYKLKDHTVGLKLSEHNLTNCETSQLNKSTKLPVTKDSGTGAS